MIAEVSKAAGVVTNEQQLLLLGQKGNLLLLELLLEELLSGNFFVHFIPLQSQLLQLSRKAL